MLNRTVRTTTVLTFALLLSTVFLVARPAKAASNLTATTPDTAPKTTVTVTPELKQAWQGYYRLPAVSVVRLQPPALVALLNTFYGRGAANSSAKNYHTYYYNPEAIYQWLNKTITPTVDIPAQEPHLTIEDGRATEFEPPQIGRRLNVYQSTLNVIAALEKNQSVAALAIDTAFPKTELGELNNLGIKELISRGQSSFKGSPSNRRHNIAVGVSKMKGVIIAPGEEFSFNKYLGPVEATEGFLPELVIKATGTVPELGGGLCQVSSTTFRAAMKAGLPITQRRNHSYAVQYYAPQGTDATIYPGVIDLKFVNDTPGSILIWPYFPDDNTLVFDFYGTLDDRQVTLQDPVVFDRQSNGAMKASWTRTVVKNGVSESKTFNSVYLPPALFHKQEQFVANPTSPTTTTPPGENPGNITPTPVPATPPTNAPTNSTQTTP